jgi:hypothetical protein
VVGPFRAPSRIRVGQKIVLEVGLKNVGTAAVSPWFAVGNLPTVASLIACSPKCTKGGSSSRLEYLNMPPLPIAASASYKLTFLAETASHLHYTVIVSGRAQPSIADADHQWTLSLTIAH